MTDETTAKQQAAKVAEEAAPDMPGADQPSADAQVAAAEQPLPEEAPETEAPPAEDEAAKYLALAQRTQADFENFRKRAVRENAAAADRGMAKLAKELLPALDHLELALRLGRGARRRRVREGHPPDPGRADRRARARRHPGLLAQGRAVRPRRARGDGLAAGRGRRVRDRDRGLPAGYRINGAVLRPARVVVAA